MAVSDAATELLRHGVSNDQSEIAISFSVESTLQLRSFPAGVSVAGYATPMEWKTLLSCLEWLFSSLSHDQPSVLKIRRFVPSTSSIDESQVNDSEFVVKEEIILPPHTANDTCWLGLIVLGIHWLGHYPNIATPVI